MNIIIVNGMPRSGTSWLGQIFNSCPDVRFKLSPLFSYEFKNKITNASSKSDICNFFKQVYESKNKFLNQDDKIFSNYPIFKIKNCNPKNLVIKSTRHHYLSDLFLDKIDRLKFVHIVRNPCGAINSWLKCKKEFSENEDYVKNWRSGACRKTSMEEYWGFDDWLFVTKMYEDLSVKYPQNVLIISYEDLVENRFQITKKVFKFCNLKFSTQTEDFLNKSMSVHQSGDYDVFKSVRVKDSWRQELDAEIVKEIYSFVNNTRYYKYVK